MKKTLLILAFAAGMCALTAPAQGQPPRYKVHGNHLVLAQPGDPGPLFVEERLGQFVPVPGGKAKASPPAATAESKKLGPAACAVVRLELAKELRKKDPTLTRFQALRKAHEAADDDTINQLRVEAEKVAGQKFGAIGDGSIIQAIIDFFKSPAGAALLQALIQMLIHLIGGL